MGDNPIYTWNCLIYSFEGRPIGYLEVPDVATLLLTGITVKLRSPIRGSGTPRRLSFPPPPVGPPPPEQTGARRKRQRQDQERPAEQDGLHRATAHGPGEEIWETKVPFNTRQVFKWIQSNSFIPKPSYCWCAEKVTGGNKSIQMPYLLLGLMKPKKIPFFITIDYRLLLVQGSVILCY